MSFDVKEKKILRFRSKYQKMKTKKTPTIHQMKMKKTNVEKKRKRNISEANIRNTERAGNTKRKVKNAKQNGKKVLVAVKVRIMKKMKKSQKIPKIKMRLASCFYCKMLAQWQIPF